MTPYLFFKKKLSWQYPQHTENFQDRESQRVHASHRLPFHRSPPTAFEHDSKRVLRILIGEESYEPRIIILIACTGLRGAGLCRNLQIRQINRARECACHALTHPFSHHCECSKINRHRDKCRCSLCEQRGSKELPPFATAAMARAICTGVVCTEYCPIAVK